MMRGLVPGVAFAVVSVALVMPACGGRSLQDFSSDDAGGEGGKSDAGGSTSCGKSGFLCLGNEFCALDPPGSCDLSSEGLCRPRPTVCGTECGGVCGCDGKAYCNTCEAQRAGTDVSGDKGCFSSTGDYQAFTLITDLPRFVLFKANTARNVCMRVTFAQTGTGPYHVTAPSNYAVEKAEITDHAGDCIITSAGVPPTPSGNSVQAQDGDGFVQFLDGDAAAPRPCGLFLHMRFGFDRTSAPWAPALEALDADNIDVAGSCQ